MVVSSIAFDSIRVVAFLKLRFLWGFLGYMSRLLGVTQVVSHRQFHTFGKLIEFKPRL